MGKKCKCPPAAPVWLTTFSDLNSLLMTMFIALFSMATLSPGKFQQASASLTAAFRGQPLGVLTGGKSAQDEPLITSNPGVKENLLKIIEDDKYKGKLTVEETDRGSLVSLKDLAVFREGSAELTATAKEVLAVMAKLIIEHTDNDVEIYGYTDDRDTIDKTVYPSNFHLGAARASSVADFFVREYKQRRMLELASDIKSGRFDIEFFYDQNRFYPVSLGDTIIKKELETLKADTSAKRTLLNDDFKANKVSYADYQIKMQSIESTYNTELEKMRSQFRRIDILILKERVR